MTSAPTCPSCGQPRPARFCGHCGERAVGPDELSLNGFFRSLGEELVPGLEAEENQPGSRMGGRIYRTVYTLFRHPGQLTADYVAGRRRPYLKPIQVFLTISLIFFLFGNNYFQYDLGEYEYIAGYGETGNLLAGELQRTGQSVAEYRERFDARLDAQKKVMIAFTIPIFALGFVPLYRRRRYGEHFVFAIHFFALLLLFMVTAVLVVFQVLRLVALATVSIAPGIMAAIQALFNSELSLVLLIYTPMVVYLIIALRRVYGGGRAVTVLKALALVTWHLVMILMVFRNGLFFSTFYSLRWFG